VVKLDDIFRVTFRLMRSINFINKINRHLVRRILLIIGIYIISIITSLVLTSLTLIVIDMKAPLDFFHTLYFAVLSDPIRFSNILTRTIPVWLIALGISCTLRVGFYNIGGDGQFLFGAILALGLVDLFYGLTGGVLPGPIYIIFALIGGILGGVLSIVIPLLLKVWRNSSEVLATILLNNIAFLLVELLVLVLWRDPLVVEPVSFAIPEVARLPLLVPRSSLHFGVIVPVLLTILIYFIFNKSVLGLEFLLTGVNKSAAIYDGVNIKKSMIVAALLSGGLAGLAGAIELLGVSYRLFRGLTVGFGTAGVIVAWLSKSNPLVIPAFALLFSSLFATADALQRTLQLPVGFVYTTFSMMLLVLIFMEKTFERVR